MRRRYLGLAVAIALAPSPAAAIDKYVCIGEQATGFHWNGTTWAQTALQVADQKYIIADVDPKDFRSQNGRYTVSVTGLGEHFPSSLCETPQFETISCHSEAYGEMRINLHNLRWLSFYPHGYVNGADNNDDTPGVTIGRCSKLP
jgi:hypothetical protein